MPVPAPYHPKPPTHRVIKPLYPTSAQTKLKLLASDAQPVPPLAFGTREDWLSTLSSWRRDESRTTWEEGTTNRQGFHKGLTAADNASVIKGAHAEACIPPMYKPIEASQLVGGATGYSKPVKSEPDIEGFGSDNSSIYDSSARWCGRAYVAHSTLSQDQPRHVTGTLPTAPLSSGPNHQQGFPPLFDDHSPGSASGPDSSSSPSEPITPFADFVDRIVAAAPSDPASNDGRNDSMVVDCTHDSKSNIVPDFYHTSQTFPTTVEQPIHVDQIPDTVVPTASCGYKKLAAPLSEWVANYVWRVCTTGFSLPLGFVQSPPNLGHYPAFPPSFLAPSINSVLLSTLLQPSAVLLAIWYIVRLPVFFGTMPPCGEFSKEKAFRTALLGDAFQVDASEVNAPFRLVILGFMLANKWLDDHTFSNKTWHSISNISIRTLNSLESIALDIFNYDLSVSSHQWSQWLAHVISYHLSLTSPIHPQPISRPSSNPHSIVRKAIEDIIQAPAACSSATGILQPIFIGLEDRLRERMEREKAMDVLEIDLDEDGPLREEYLPKRRASALESSESHTSRVTRDSNSEKRSWDLSKVPVIKQLPPPAKWSPAGDEPILRDKNRASGQYVAVQAPHPGTAAHHPSCQPQTIGYNQNWIPYLSTKSQSGYTYDVPSIIRVTQPSYTPLGHVASVAVPHSRSQSLSYDQDNMRNHMRSFSQARFDYNNDVRMAADELITTNNVEPCWMDPAIRYPYHGAFIPVLAVSLQPAW